MSKGLFSTHPPLKTHKNDVAPGPAGARVGADPPRHFANEEERTLSFGRALDALKAEAEARIDATDLAHIQRVRSISRRLQWLGRSLIHVSFEPLCWTAGVALLSGHKLLELIEIGHTVLHGTYDHMDVDDQLRSETFNWRAPIDEASWRTGHNLRHHQFTNIAGRDPDLDFGVLRLAAFVPFQVIHRLQPLSNFVSWTYFSTAINVHVSGLLALYAGRPATRERSHTWSNVWSMHRAALGKLGRYYGREYVLFPALAGPFFLKVLLANAASELFRDLYAAATIYCGHVGAREYPEGTRAKARANWYRMQVEGSRDFEVQGVLALLCGGLERQIEHHLFPRLPPNRLREIAPRVASICQEHGIQYRSDTWPKVLADVVRRLRVLGTPTATA